MLFTDVQESLKPHLQCETIISVRNKIYKKGKLILFNEINNLLQLTMLSDQMYKFEIPIPFAIESHLEDGIIFFDYRIKYVIDKNDASVDLIYKMLTQFKPHKFFDSIVTLEFQ